MSNTNYSARAKQLKSLHENRSSHECLILSDIPQQCQRKNEEVVLGIDEAGRGPILGPMTYAAVYWSRKEEERLVQNHDFQDSKQMSKEARKVLFEKMIQVKDLGYVLRVLHANEISGNMLRPIPYNLNAMSHDAAMQMISTVLESGVNVTKVFIDTVGLPDAYKAKLDRKFYGKGIEFVVEKKADSKFPTCSAASILAKVMRDELIDNWKFSEGKFYQPLTKEYGSGYPSDPKCKTWMEQNLQDRVFCYPDFVRFSWGPAKDAVEEHGVKVDWEADEEEDNDDSQPRIDAFMSSSKNKKKRARTQYFEKKNLTVVESIFC